MTKVNEHPTIGRLIPDSIGEDLMFFRQFKQFKMFWLPDSKKQLEDLEPEHRFLVKKWKKQPEGLPEVCRNFDVLAALQSLGAYEVGFSSAEDESLLMLTAGQEKAWQDFSKQESTYCENACSALIRYFNHLRKIDPELFREEEDCPESAKSIEDLASCVRFDGMNISPEAKNGHSTISFGWDVDWDMEHGLQMIFHNQQVIAMGNDLYSPEDICSAANFYREILSEDEQSAFNNFEKEFKSASEDDS
ncbi:MAG: hypothetical protein HON04_02520 [Planctomicrobium sp.]|jgi:hypothetical protein|nr:hypothetical protein [Planctomicrobium sp.]